MTLIVCRECSIMCELCNRCVCKMRIKYTFITVYNTCLSTEMEIWVVLKCFKQITDRKIMLKSAHLTTALSSLKMTLVERYYLFNDTVFVIISGALLLCSKYQTFINVGETHSALCVVHATSLSCRLEPLMLNPLQGSRIAQCNSLPASRK